MLWVLSLYAPLDYLENHPFDLKVDDDILFFKINNALKGQAQELPNNSKRTIRSLLELQSPERGSNSDFKVFIDDVELFRPLKFKNLPKTNPNTPFTLMFFGKANPDLSNIPEDMRGGDLSFEAYFIWNHSIIPKDHSGVMVRINDSSGTLFDETFMKYPISELTRKTQVTAEIFVTKGLDAALNIDRESINQSHPHAVYIMNWVHNAFRQLATRQKAIAKMHRENQRSNKLKEKISTLESAVNDRIKTIVNQDDFIPQDVEFEDEQKEIFRKRKHGSITYNRNIVFADRSISKRSARSQDTKYKQFEVKLKLVAKVLNAFGLLENLSYDQQQHLLREIVNIFAE